MKQKKSRSLDAIGKRKYDFDFQLESTIYCCLCCKHVKNRKLKKLDNKLKFNSYKQWEKYVKNKYLGYDSETLIEFSRYLNHMIRNNKSGNKYWELCIPVVLTILLTEWIKVFMNSQMIFVILGFVASLLFFIWYIFNPMFNEYWDGCMLKDYKEIIDSMIKE